MTAVLEARPVGGALADDTRSGSVRLVRVEAFEPAVYVAPEHRDAYERRFVTLLVDEASRRRGGVGEVLHARNPRGERFRTQAFAAVRWRERGRWARRGPSSRIRCRIRRPSRLVPVRAASRASMVAAASARIRSS